MQNSYISQIDGNLGPFDRTLALGDEKSMVFSYQRMLDHFGSMWQNTTKDGLIMQKQMRRSTPSPQRYFLMCSIARNRFLEWYKR